MRARTLPRVKRMRAGSSKTWKSARGSTALQLLRQGREIGHVGEAVLDLALDEDLKHLGVDPLVDHFFEMAVVVDDVAQGRE